jgi:hypothetical protein
MKNKISLWVYYRILRFIIKRRTEKENSITLTPIQEKVYKIVNALISEKNSELLINPSIEENIGEKYYIKTMQKDKIEKFITISRTSMGYRVTIIGQEYIEPFLYNYHYDVSFDNTIGYKIVNKFIKSLKNRRNKVEKNIRLGDQKILELIFQNIKK